MTQQDDVREQVRARYAAAATAVSEQGREVLAVLDGDSCCAPATSADSAPTENASSCGGGTEVDVAFGSGLYSAAEQGELPAEAVAASLGCGNPLMVADLKAGEKVLDLGSGGGIDVLLSAKRVGPTGFAYGVDMTDEMLELARANATKASAANIKFVKGTIEEIPLPDASVDVVISNCVINLSVDKPAVLAQMFRVLTPGGRIGISDVVAEDQLSEADRALPACPRSKPQALAGSAPPPHRRPPCRTRRKNNPMMILVRNPIGRTHAEDMRAQTFARLSVLVAVASIVAGCSAANGGGGSPKPPLQLRLVTSSAEGPCSAPPLTSDGPGSACDRAGTTTYELAKSLGVVTPTSVKLDGQSGQTVVAEFDKADASKLGDVTSKALEKQLAILLDGQVLTAPVVKEPMTAGKVTFTFGTASEAEQVAAELGASATS